MALEMENDLDKDFMFYQYSGWSTGFKVQIFLTTNVCHEWFYPGQLIE